MLVSSKVETEKKRSPFNEALKVLLDEETNLVFNSWDVGRVCRPRSVGNLIIFETFSLIIAWSPKTLRRRSSRTARR
jgi:hypothetical protein